VNHTIIETSVKNPASKQTLKFKLSRKRNSMFFERQNCCYQKMNSKTYY